MKHIIWQNYNLNLDDWKEGLLEDAEINNEDVSGFTEYDWHNRMYERNDEYLDDERMNLDIPTKGLIICIADLGLWNGRRTGYKYCGYNINGCLSLGSDCEYGEFYVDKYNNLRSRQSHHDGTNLMLYREIKPDITNEQIDNFCMKLYNGTATSKDITRYTRSLGKRIKNVYGW